MTQSALDLTEDIRPISEFRANAAALLKQVQNTGRPVVLTQHGRSAAVLVDVDSYQQMTNELETLRAIACAHADHAEGRVIEHADFMTQLRSRVTEK